MSLRSHRDDSKYYDETENNPGNLQAILSYLVRCVDNKIFQDHFENALKTAMYRSKTTQNSLIKICGNILTDKLICDVKNAKFFSILADESADISNKEQMAFVIRFVDEASVIREKFVHFNEGLNGRAVADKILHKVNSLGLDMDLCIGQGYDGAGNMAGKCSGAATLIQKDHPIALYVHCRAYVYWMFVGLAGLPELMNWMCSSNSLRLLSVLLKQ